MVAVIVGGAHIDQRLAILALDLERIVVVRMGRAVDVVVQLMDLVEAEAAVVVDVEREHGDLVAAQLRRLHVTDDRVGVELLHVDGQHLNRIGAAPGHGRVGLLVGDRQVAFGDRAAIIRQRAVVDQEQLERMLVLEARSGVVDLIVDVAVSRVLQGAEHGIANTGVDRVAIDEHRRTVRAEADMDLGLGRADQRALAVAEGELEAGIIDLAAQLEAEQRNPRIEDRDVVRAMLDAVGFVVRDLGERVRDVQLDAAIVDLAEERDVVLDAERQRAGDRRAGRIRDGEVDRNVLDLLVGADQAQRRIVVEVVVQLEDDLELAVRLVLVDVDREHQAIDAVIELARRSAVVDECDDAVAVHARIRRHELIADRLAFGGQAGRQLGEVERERARNFAVEIDLDGRDGLERLAIVVDAVAVLVLTVEVIRRIELAALLAILGVERIVAFAVAAALATQHELRRGELILLREVGRIRTKIVFVDDAAEDVEGDGEIRRRRPRLP